MSVPPVPYLLNPKQQQAVVNYVSNCVTSLASVWNLRQQFLNRDLIYYREMDRSVEQTKALQANMAGDPFKFQNLQIPVVMPQVESALAYQAGVFLTGYPISPIGNYHWRQLCKLWVDSPSNHVHAGCAKVQHCSYGSSLEAQTHLQPSE
jgi:hypothetical protein